MSPLTAMAAALGLLAAGYAIGRYNPGPRLLSWAEDATSPGWRTWKFWPAAPVVLVALAWVWTVHPRRTLANVRAWREPVRPRGPALEFRSPRIPDHRVNEEQEPTR
ncbi:hypothetical protein [Streptomyces sp. NPDC093269]|uniref:hypothetical protein n=1 Tax=Streptomyces sp. NPDC093269 TaxID=3366038 RepID=UPI003808F53E